MFGKIYKQYLHLKQSTKCYMAIYNGYYQLATQLQHPLFKSSFDHIIYCFSQNHISIEINNKEIRFKYPFIEQKNNIEYGICGLPQQFVSFPLIQHS